MGDPEIICGGLPMLNRKHERMDWLRNEGMDEYELQADTPRRSYVVFQDVFHKGSWIASLVTWANADSDRRVTQIPADLPALTYLHPSREMAMVACERHLKEHP